MSAAFTIVAVFAWTLGSEVLLEPVQPGALLLPLLLACMLVWGVARDDLALFPWLVGVASLLLQTYVTYVFLVAFIAVWAVLCIVLRLHASHYDREQVRRVRTTGLVALAVGLVCWIQPIYQQFFGDGPGNFTQLWRAVRSPTKTYGPNTGTRLMADVVSLPPFWFRPSFHDFLAVRNVPKSSLPVAIVTLLVVAALLAVLAAYSRSAAPATSSAPRRRPGSSCSSPALSPRSASRSGCSGCRARTSTAGSGRSARSSRSCS